MSLFSNLYSTAVNTTDKTKMKYICNNNKISTAAYNEFTNINDINTKSFNYPVIVNHLIDLLEEEFHWLEIKMS